MVDPFALRYNQRLVITNVDFPANKPPANKNTGRKSKAWVGPKVGDIVIATNRHITIAGEDKRWNYASWCVQIEWNNTILYWPDNCLENYVPISTEGVTPNISPIARVKRSWS